MTSILWVEDQLHWIDKFTPALQTARFEGQEEQSTNEILVFKFAEAACQYIKLSKKAPDIAILDANMNGNDNAGFSVSRAIIRKWPSVPIIYLSEHSGTNIEQRALEQAETQDFIAKHQDNIEAILCWRIKAVLRQKSINEKVSTTTQEQIIRNGDLTIDLSTWNVYWYGQKLMNPNNIKRPLPPAPRKILRCLVECSPRPLSTQQIADFLELDKFNYASYRQHIKTLRHSFEQVTELKNQPSFINACKNGHGITTFGDEGAYCWTPFKPTTITQG